jgi:hypothetical protein
MRYAALLIAAALATTNLGCHTMGRGLLHGCGCLECTGVAGCSDCGSCSHEQACDDCMAADVGGMMHHHAGGGGGLLGHHADGGGLLGHHAQAGMTPPPGPQVGTVTYPYYTFHGPRDFLQSDTPSLGR